MLLYNLYNLYSDDLKRIKTNFYIYLFYIIFGINTVSCDNIDQCNIFLKNHNYPYNYYQLHFILW